MAPLYEIDRSIPCELVRKILTVVLADSVFTICFSASSVSWEIDAATTLSLVSFAFREIVKEVATKAFEIPKSEEGPTVLSVVRRKLLYLRNLGKGDRSQLDGVQTEPREAPALIRAYALWLTSTELREDSAGDPKLPSVFVHTHETIERALDLSRDVCGKVQPRGMAFPLLQALERDRLLVQTGRELVEARVKMHEALKRMENIEDQTREENIRIGDSIKLDIHESLSRVETADLFNTDKQTPFMTDTLYRTHQLPPLLAVIHRCGQLRFDLDEYDIGRRVQSLLDSYESHELQT